MNAAATTYRLSDYADKFAGAAAWMFGRGRTQFDYETIAGFAPGTPVGFINDAVQLETRLPAECPSFLFALDSKQAAHMKRPLRSVPVAGDNGPFRNIIRERGIPAVLGHQLGGEPDPSRKAWTVRNNWIYQHASGGSVTLGVYFFWICGVTRIQFVGCDGLTKPPPYDERLLNISGTHPGVVSNYKTFRKWQDKQCLRLGIEPIYVGTPTD